MLKQLMVSRKIEQRNATLAELTDKAEELTTRSTELESAIEEARTDEELEAVTDEVEKHTEARDEHDEKVEEIKQEIADLQAELEKLEENAPKTNEGDERNMTSNLEVREGIQSYVRSKGQVRDGFTSVEGGALIPEEILAAEQTVEDEVDLSKLVNVAQVNSGAGKYPVIKKSGKKMASVEELAKNPELAKPSISDVKYDIKTFRGFIPVSQEIIEDSSYDVSGLIADEINDQELNTKNEAIATVLKGATAKATTGFDGLKGVFNVDIKRVYNAKAIISASLFNELDTTKDNNGRYLLQDDVTVESGKKLFGKEVVVLDDDIIGTKDGDLVGFIGDPKAFATLFDRKRASVKWVDNDIYGQLLAGYVRFDVKETDKDAGFYVTYEADTTTVDPEGA